MRWFLIIVILFFLPNFTPPNGEVKAEVMPKQVKQYDLAQPINDLVPVLDTLVAKSEGVSEKLKTL